MYDDEGAAPAPRTFANDGVHLLRTTQQVQYQLSAMADQKANMLLGITFVIFTISIAQSRGAPVQLPLIILAGSAFMAAMLAVAAVLPSVKPPPKDSTANVLFFGAFSQMREDEYVEKMLGILAEPRTVYETFARDIHQNGSVLARKKYRLIGYAYRVLLVGMIASLVAFLEPYVARLFA